MTDRSSLFWKTTTTPMTKVEFEAWSSPEQTGKRLVEHITTYLRRSLEKLPADCRDWFHIDFERPGWIDPEIPRQALHELQRLTVKMPDALPDWWGLGEGHRRAVDKVLGETLPDWWPLSREQQRAAEVLMAVREAIHATHGMDPAHALVLLERTVYLGFSLAQAHVDPWEAVEEHRRARQSKSGVDRARQMRAEAQPRIDIARKHYERLASAGEEERYLAGQVAKIMGVSARSVREWRKNNWQANKEN